MDRSVRGMSLIEVMIAVAVLTIALVSLLTAMPVATKLTRDSEQNEIARHSVEMKIAEIRAAGAAQADSFNGQAFAVDELTKVDGAAECGVVEIDSGGAGPDGTKDVRVRVEWRGVDGAVRRVEVRTLVGR